ncbi:MAG: response regulator transcription factor [Acidobacteriaceae bacterium]|nr:response regulator transcription factor [Acidobacteriaceae bacterium]
MELETVKDANTLNDLSATRLSHPRVLVAEDDVPLARFLQRGFQDNEYAADLVHDGEAAANAVLRGQYDLLVTDLNLPGLDGVSLLKRIRATTSQLPILVLTARGAVEDRITSLDSGADDYLVKPFSFQELMARARALLRRHNSTSVGQIQVGDLKLNRDEFRVERGGKAIDLTAKEFALLEYLMVNAHRPVSRAMIMEKVWKTSYDGSTNLVDVYMKYVRDKVDAAFLPKLLRTIRGVGYLLSDRS